MAVVFAQDRQFLVDVFLGCFFLFEKVGRELGKDNCHQHKRAADKDFCSWECAFNYALGYNCKKRFQGAEKGTNRWVAVSLTQELEGVGNACGENAAIENREPGKTHALGGDSAENCAEYCAQYTCYKELNTTE